MSFQEVAPTVNSRAGAPFAVRIETTPGKSGRRYLAIRVSRAGLQEVGFDLASRFSLLEGSNADKGRFRLQRAKDGKFGFTKQGKSGVVRIAAPVSAPRNRTHLLPVMHKLIGAGCVEIELPKEWR